MKRGLIGLGSLLFLGLIAFLPPQKKNKNKKEAPDRSEVRYREVGSPLPAFRVLTSAGSIYTNDSLPADGHLILLLFNPTCDHCGMVTDTLLRYYHEAQKSRLLLVAGDNMMPYLPGFIREHHIEKYPSVRVGVDSGRLIQKLFRYEPLPQVNIYDSTRRLVRIYTGLQPGSSFLPYLR